MLLKDILDQHLGWNKARTKFLANLIIALIKTRSVCLTEIATALKGGAKTKSKYKQLQRFFRNYNMDLDSVSRLIAFSLLAVTKKWSLAIDRTNWKLGKININILCIGICYKGICFPVVWKNLGKTGNSNTQERIDLLKKFIKLFGYDKINFLTGDREFIGKQWFEYLKTNEIPFRMRVKENFIVTNSRGSQVQVKAVFRNVKIGYARSLKRRRKICGVKLFIIGGKLSSREYFILVTDKEPEGALDDYALRWEIETLFSCLKTRGFNLESTHMTKPERIDRLLAVLSIAFCWCHITGEWLHEQKPIKVKKHGRRAVSFFRYGLDRLREILFNIEDYKRQYNQVVRLFARRLDDAALIGT